MRVESNRPLRPAATRRGDRTRDTGGPSFAEALAEGEMPAPTASASQVGGLGSLLALQEVEDPTQRRRQAFQRGSRLLDHLDEIQRGLLAGTIPREALTRLQRELKDTRAVTLDPRLDEILAEIELRAAVELAKLDVA
jgi:hypothetical protein